MNYCPFCGADVTETDSEQDIACALRHYKCCSCNEVYEEKDFGQEFHWAWVGEEEDK